MIRNRELLDVPDCVFVSYVCGRSYFQCTLLEVVEVLEVKVVDTLKRRQGQATFT